MKIKYNNGALEDAGNRVLAAVDGCPFDCSMNAAQQEAFGEQLAERWNAHDELVAALRELVDDLQGDIDAGANCRLVMSGKRIEFARAALAKAQVAA